MPNSIAKIYTYNDPFKKKKKRLQFLNLDIAKSFSIFIICTQGQPLIIFFYFNPEINFSPITQIWSRFKAFEDKVWSCFFRFYIPWPIVISSAFCPKKMNFHLLFTKISIIFIFWGLKRLSVIYFFVLYT